MSTVLYCLLFFGTMATILLFPQQSILSATQGLNLWFQKMIPALFPFMILSAVMVRMGLTEGFTGLVYPIVKPIFRVRKNVCYVMILGFLCGFPMGAKCVGELYARKQLTKEEAEFLLAFCNNIGPVYFISFALPTIGCEQLAIPLLGMYGMPLLYGLFLRYSCYRRNLNHCFHQKNATNTVPSQTFISALNESVISAGQSILLLGGYMILFNLYTMIPAILFPQFPNYIAPLLEISGGILLFRQGYKTFLLLCLAFCGISCIAQTYVCICQTDLSLKKYILHKINLTVLTAGYYFFLRFLRLW